MTAEKKSRWSPRLTTAALMLGTVVVAGWIGAVVTICFTWPK